MSAWAPYARSSWITWFHDKKHSLHSKNCIIKWVSIKSSLLEMVQRNYSYNFLFWLGYISQRKWYVRLKFFGFHLSFKETHPSWIFSAITLVLILTFLKYNDLCNWRANHSYKAFDCYRLLQHMHFEKFI